MRSTFVLGAAIGIAVFGACGTNGGTGPSSFSGDDGGGSTNDGAAGGDVGSFTDGNGGGDGSGGGSMVDADFPCDGCAPFPGQGATACSPTTLGPPTLVYPPDGVLLPPNMNVLEVQWVPPTTGTAMLYEVDFTNGATDIRVETACNSITSVRGVANVGCGLTLSQTEWNDLANTNANGDPVAVTVRATPANAQCVSASPQSVSINFAKENLSGGIYYWQSATYGGVAGTTGGIYSHDFGTFDPTPTPFWTSGATGTCIGCHTLSKDGVRMSLMHDDPDADDEYGDVKTLTMDVGSRTVIGGNTIGPGFQTFTHDHALMVASVFNAMGKMGNVPDTSLAVWNGDGTTLVKTNALPTGMQGTQPNLSWDDKTLVFVAPTYGTIATQANDVMGGLGGAGGDDHFMGGSLWQASFDASTGTLGNYAAFLTSTGSQNFYYPDQSSDGNWIVLNENDDTSASNNNGDCFYSRQARVKIMHFPPQAGDQPLDLPNLDVANGLTNSWPRWSPVVQTYKNHQILWVTFSSNRDYGLRLKNGGFDNYYPPEGPSYDQPQPASKQNITFDAYAAPQIWMAAIIVDPTRSLDSMDRSYPAFWLPFQDVTAHNHSAQWVATVQGGPPAGDGGTGDGGSSSGGDGAPTCNESGGSCGPSGGTCCSDVVCCPGGTYTCSYGCAQ